MDHIIEQPDQQLGYLLVQTSWLKQRINSNAFNELGVTYVQFVILAGILELGVTRPIITQQTIVVERRLDKTMVSSVVKTLIKKQLVSKSEHPTDSRAMVLKLTSKGEEIACKGKAKAKEIDTLFFDGIDKQALSNTLTFLLNKR